MFVNTLVIVMLAAGAFPASQALAQSADAVVSAPAATVPAAISVPVDKGWVKFSWSPTVRGAFTFAVSPTSTDPARLALPGRVTFVASAQVKCPAVGNAQVGVRVYDFGQLILATTYQVTCPAASASAYPVAKSADDYVNSTYYFHGSAPIAASGAHDIVVETDLATTDNLFWGYVRVDTAPGVPRLDAIDTGAIALTVVNAPANARVGVQWSDPSGSQWTDIASWSGLLTQTEGRMAYWVAAEDYGTGPYRWVVYDQDPSQGGKVWGVSEVFNFPRQAGDWVWSVVKGSSATPSSVAVH